MLTLCADGGGTKLQLLIFDESLRPVAHLRGPSVTSLYCPRRQVRAGVLAALQQLAAAVPQGYPRTAQGRLRIDRMYNTHCGGVSPAQLAAQVMELGEVVPLREGACGLLAGAAARTGVLTLSGTGSDCFLLQNGETVGFVGGYGPVLGDEGSGYDLGRQALAAAIRADEGRGPATLLRDYVFEDYGLKERMFELVRVVHASADSRAPVARATYTLGRAAAGGDAVALDILRRAGERLALDTAALLTRAGEDESCALPATVSGGAWKVHPLLWETFRRRLLERYPALALRPPCFEPVMAGVVDTVLRAEGGLSPARLKALQRDFAPFAVRDAYVQCV